jgi:3-isopropylmalate/(R)-2-methylmalate dehydratase small subunit
MAAASRSLRSRAGPDRKRVKSMEPFTILRAVAAPLDVAKIDTGMIMPGRYSRKYRRPGHPDYAEGFLHDLRFDANDQMREDFVLNQPAYQGAEILVTATDFGCGSSRETAAYAVLDYGLRALIGPSFGDIFNSNCLQNGILVVVLTQAEVSELWRQLGKRPGAPVGIDLERQDVTAPDGEVYRFDIDPTRKKRLLGGLDDVAVTMEYIPQLERFEHRYASEMSWLAPII